MKKVPSEAARISYALSKYGFTTPDIEYFLSRVLSAPSDRTIKKQSGVDDNVLKVGRRRVSTRVPIRAVQGILTVAHLDPEVFGENILHLFHLVHKGFDLAPRQFLNWVGEQVRHGGKTLRPCIRCRSLFPSMSSGDRVGPCCEQAHRKALREAASALDDTDYLSR